MKIELNIYTEDIQDCQAPEGITVLSAVQVLLGLTNLGIVVKWQGIGQAKKFMAQPAGWDRGHDFESFEQAVAHLVEKAIS